MRTRLKNEIFDNKTDKNFLDQFIDMQNGSVHSFHIFNYLVHAIPNVARSFLLRCLYL